GAEGVVLAERLFQADSEAALALAAANADDPRGEARWRLALAGMHLLLTDLGFDRPARRSIAREARDRFAEAHALGADLKHPLAALFRKERPKLEALLRPGVNGPLGAGLAVLRHRSEWLAPVAAALRECAAGGGLTAPLADLAPSYLHLHAN